jgi:hypothetical protein
MTLPADLAVIRDPLTGSFLQSYSQDGARWNWTWVGSTSLTAARCFDRAEAERIVQESGQIMFQVLDLKAAEILAKPVPDMPPTMQVGDQVLVNVGQPQRPPEPIVRTIPIKPPEPKDLEYMLVKVDRPGPENEVTGRLQSKWKLYGPPFVLGEVVYQAMIREIPS